MDCTSLPADVWRVIGCLLPLRYMMRLSKVCHLTNAALHNELERYRLFEPPNRKALLERAFADGQVNYLLYHCLALDRTCYEYVFRSVGRVGSAKHFEDLASRVPGPLFNGASRALMYEEIGKFGNAFLYSALPPRHGTKETKIWHALLSNDTREAYDKFVLIHPRDPDFFGRMIWSMTNLRMPLPRWLKDLPANYGHPYPEALCLIALGCDVTIVPDISSQEYMWKLYLNALVYDNDVMANKLLPLLTETVNNETYIGSKTDALVQYVKKRDYEHINLLKAHLPEETFLENVLEAAARNGDWDLLAQYADQHRKYAVTCASEGLDADQETIACYFLTLLDDEMCRSLFPRCSRHVQCTDYICTRFEPTPEDWGRWIAPLQGAAFVDYALARCPKPIIQTNYVIHFHPTLLVRLIREGLVRREELVTRSSYPFIKWLLGE